MKFDHDRDFIRIVQERVLEKALCDLDPNNIHSLGKEKREFLMGAAPLMYGKGSIRDLTRRNYLFAAREFGRLFRGAIGQFEYLPN